jgi:hypothetical protein
VLGWLLHGSFQSVPPHLYSRSINFAADLFICPYPTPSPLTSSKPWLLFTPQNVPPEGVKKRAERKEERVVCVFVVYLCMCGVLLT